MISGGPAAVTSILSLPTIVKTLLIAILLMRFALPSSASDDGEACADSVLNLGFYAYFEPVSYSAAMDPDSADFNRQRGYEADLLTALEAMEGAGLSFNRQAISEWDGIWLRSASPEYDIIGGGITILDSRRRDKTGDEAITFTSGHITFRQSLLVRVEDAERLKTHADLTSDDRVGVLAGTTGEARLLQLIDLVDEEGVLADGVHVETAEGVVIADGSADFFITAAAASDVLAERQRLYAPATGPQVIYLGSRIGDIELLEALGNAEIEAVARGEIGNRDAVRDSDGAFAITALDDSTEYGGFTLDIDDAELAVCMDALLDWLTDDRRIGYGEWLDDPAIFLTRAKAWNEKQEQEAPNEMNADEQ